MPVNPFWPHTHARAGAWPSGNWLDVQSGNTVMEWFVRGIPHEEDRKPAAPRTQEMPLHYHLLLVLPL